MRDAQVQLLELIILPLRIEFYKGIWSNYCINSLVLSLSIFKIKYLSVKIFV